MWTSINFFSDFSPLRFTPSVFLLSLRWSTFPTSVKFSQSSLKCVVFSENWRCICYCRTFSRGPKCVMNVLRVFFCFSWFFSQREVAFPPILLWVCDLLQHNKFFRHQILFSEISLKGLWQGSCQISTSVRLIFLLPKGCAKWHHMPAKQTFWLFMYVIDFVTCVS